MRGAIPNEGKLETSPPSSEERRPGVAVYYPRGVTDDVRVACGLAVCHSTDGESRNLQ